MVKFNRNTVNRIASIILADEYQYVYDPEHRNKPREGEFFETDRGWSNDPKDATKEENLIPSEKQSGTTQVATTIGSYKNAMSSILKIKPDVKNVLDYGAGLGLGTDAISESGIPVDSLEVNPQRWRGKNPPTYTNSSQIKKKYDSIINLNVLNVLPKNIRDLVLKDIGSKLSVGGVALIGTRAWKMDVDRAKNFVPVEDEEKAIRINKKDGMVFQKGFDGDELQKYAQSLLGEKFSVARSRGYGANCIVIKKNAE